MNLTSSQRKNPKVQSLEAVAYFEGAHGSEVKPGLERIQADFDQKAANTSHAAVVREKKHETLLDRVRASLPEAERRAAQINEKLGDENPHLVLPTLIAVAACLMIVAEIVFLAPAFDMLNITNGFLQYLIATGLVCTSSVAFHFCWESFASKRFPLIQRIASRVLAAAFVFFLVEWGILRAKQAALAAGLGHNPVGAFLSAHPVLAAMFFIFLSLGTPLVVAIAAHYSFHHLREWWQWKKANSELKGLNDTKVGAQKQLETEREQHQQALKQLAHECAEWRSTYRLHHELGAKNKALQEPMGIVYLKSAVAAVVTGSVLFLASPPLAAAAALAAGITAFIHFRHKREHPDPEKYHQEKQIQFAPRARNVTPLIEPPLIEAKVESHHRPLLIDANVAPKSGKRGLAK
jgi:Flp pilus assembly protein TadB